MLQILIYFFLSILFSSFIFRLLLSAERNDNNLLRIYDYPNNRKIHKNKILKVGGIIILFSSLFMLTFYRILNKENLFQMSSSESHLFIATIFLILGALFDDLIEIDAPKKLFFQVIAIAIIVNSGYVFKLFANNLLNIFLTFCLFVIIINSMNLIDGIDGLSTGIFTLFVLTAIAVSLKFSIINPKYYILFSIFLGSIVSFLILNFPPAKVFLGDMGSQLFGWILSVCIVYYSSFFQFNYQKIYLLSFISLPFYDVFFVMIKRFILRPGFLFNRILGIVKPDQNHIHHLVLLSGFSSNRTMGLLILFYFVCLIISMIPIFLNDFYFLIFIIVLALNITFRIFFEHKLKIIKK